MSGDKTFVAAARAILTEAGEALHYREITERALTRGLLRTSGKTPEESLNARLCVEIKDHGEASEFVRVAPGVFGLRGRLGEGQVPQPVKSDDDASARVRVPYYPRYDDVRAVLPAWIGLAPERVTGLHRTRSRAGRGSCRRRPAQQDDIPQVAQRRSGPPAGRRECPGSW